MFTQRKSWRVGCLQSYNGATGEPEAFVYRLEPDDPEETAHNRICVRGSKTKLDCDADARLIAAAPDLYEALYEIREACCSGAGSLPAEDIARAQAAMDKAEAWEWLGAKR